MKQRTLEEWDELGRKGVYNVRQLFEQAKNHISLSNLRLRERYLNREIELLVHVRQIGHSGNTPEFCAVIRNGAEERHSKSERRAAGRSISRESHGCGGFQISDDKQQIVLVGNVKLVKFPEIVTSSFVWLGSLNDVYRTRMDSLYYSRISYFVSGSYLVNRKCGTPRDYISIGLDQLARHMVKSTSHVVDGIAGDEGKLNRRPGDLLNPIDSLKYLRIIIDDESIRIGFEESSLGCLELIDVVFGPFDFRPNLCESA